MSSAPISTVPEVGKPVVSIKVMLVADPLLPLASSARAPSSVVATAELTEPPYNPVPQPIVTGKQRIRY